MQNIISLFHQSKHSEVISLSREQSFDAYADPIITQYVAASCFKLGKYDDAYNLLKELYAVFIDNVSYLSLFAATCRHLGKLKESNLYFERALQIDGDDIYLKNNYSNLLIDLNRHHEAKELLLKILDSDPNYEDAKINLYRVETYLSSLSKLDNVSDTSKLDDEDLDSKTDFVDPLFFAFTQEEVERTAPFRPVASTGDLTTATLALQANLPPAQISEIASDQIKVAYQAISENNPAFALKLCTKAYPTSLDKSEVLSCVGDAYVSLKDFQKAEIAYLHSINLGNKSFKNYFNLITLSMLKQDFLLAEHYLGKAAYIDASNVNLSRLKTSIQKLMKSSESSFSFACDLV